MIIRHNWLDHLTIIRIDRRAESVTSTETAVYKKTDPAALIYAPKLIHAIHYLNVHEFKKKLSLFLSTDIPTDKHAPS